MAGPPSKTSDWLLKVPPLLIGLALGPGPRSLSFFLNTFSDWLPPRLLVPALFHTGFVNPFMGPPLSLLLAATHQGPPNPTFSSRLFLLSLAHPSPFFPREFARAF